MPPGRTQPGPAPLYTNDDLGLPPVHPFLQMPDYPVVGPEVGWAQGWPSGGPTPYYINDEAMAVGELQSPNALMPSKAGTGPGMAYGSVPAPAPPPPQPDYGFGPEATLGSSRPAPLPSSSPAAQPQDYGFGPPATLGTPAPSTPPVFNQSTPTTTMTPRQMANPPDDNGEGAFGDISSMWDAAKRAGKFVGGFIDLPGGEDVQRRPAPAGPIPGAAPAAAAPARQQVPPAPAPPFPDYRRQQLESQGFSEALPGQFIKISQNSNTPMNQGFGKSWTPAGGGAFSGSNSFTNPDIEAAEQVSDNDRLAAVAQSKQRVQAAQMAPQQAHPDPFQQRARAAAMIAQLPEPVFRKMVEALNALVRGNYDQNSLGMLNLPSELQPPQ